MEAVVSAVMADLAGRSVSFLVDRYLNRTVAAGTDDDGERLGRLLRRAHVVVEEAERRRVTNHAMLRQLDALRAEMYRGYHALDRHMAGRGPRKDDDHPHAGAGDDGDDDGAAPVSNPSAMSHFSPAKRVRLMIRSRSRGSRRQQIDRQRRLQHVLGRLETAIADVKDEFVVLLTACPPMVRQPYIMHMILDRCMFGRQMEMERVVAFLLHAEEEEGGGGDHDGNRKLGILPIVGPRRAGKSTLVEHVCKDERVRDHFSQIVSFTLGDLTDENMVTLRNGRVIGHRHRASNDQGRVLVIVELDGDRNSKGLDGPIIEELFGKLHSVCRTRVPRVSKIIVTSRSDKISSLGTTEPLRLDYVAQEAYWYFFKVRAFGSTNTLEHPKLVSIAMDMAVEMDRCFALVDVFAGRLRSNLNARFWRLTLAVIREFKKKNLLMNNACHSGQIPEVTKLTEEFVYHNDYEIIGCVHEQDPMMVSLQDLLFGDAGARPRGKFDVLGWKSHIPPCYSYVYSCEILRPQCMGIAHQEEDGN